MSLKEKYQVLLTQIRIIIQLKKTTDYNTKINEIEKKICDHNHDRYITTSEFNQLIAKNFPARLEQVSLVTKVDFDNELINIDKNIFLC